MKEYMLLYKGGEHDWQENCTPEEMAAVMERWGIWMANLQEKGQLLSGGSPLDYEGTRLNADGVITDITAAEFKELVSGYSIIKAASMKDAIAAAKTCPMLEKEGGIIDVRPVTIMDCA